MSRAGRLLIVEDDAAFGTVMAAYMESAGYETHRVTSAAEALDRIGHNRWDAILLDLNLPDEDGIAVTRMLRARSEVPIVIVTGRLESADRLTTLELGADDFVTKPFEPRELVARVRNLLRRTHKGASDVSRYIVCGDWRVDMGARTLAGPTGAPIDLTPAEFDVFVALARAAGRVLSRSQLIDAIANLEAPESERAVDVLVSRLRRKLAAHGPARVGIKTVRGVGYRLDERAGSSTLQA